MNNTMLYFLLLVCMSAALVIAVSDPQVMVTAMQGYQTPSSTHVQPFTVSDPDDQCTDEDTPLMLRYSEVCR